MDHEGDRGQYRREYRNGAREWALVDIPQSCAIIVFWCYDSYGSKTSLPQGKMGGKTEIDLFRGGTAMPIQSQHIPMSYEAWQLLPYQPGWKYEYIDGCAHMMPSHQVAITQNCVVAAV